MGKSIPHVALTMMTELIKQSETSVDIPSISSHDVSTVLVAAFAAFHSSTISPNTDISPILSLSERFYVDRSNGLSRIQSTQVPFGSFSPIQKNKRMLYLQGTSRFRGGGAFRNTSIFRPRRKGESTLSETNRKICCKKKTFGSTDAARYKSVMFMALAMAWHYLGYSLARPTTISLFTSKATGYSSPVAFPFANAFVSPVSLLLLLGYGNVLERYGPRGALQRTTLACATVIIGVSGAIAQAQQTNTFLWKTSIPVVKLLSGLVFVFRESYVQLLTSQYWSFMASVLTPNESAKWFAPIAGLTSISSVLGGSAVSFLGEKLKLPGTLACAGLSLLMSLVATGSAYSIAEKHEFSPKRSFKTKRSNSRIKEQPMSSGHNYNYDNKANMIVTAKNLFARVPVLTALFSETLASQALATLLNVCFVKSLSIAIPDDQIRAGWLGNFYAIINLITMSLQFGFLPFLMKYIEPKHLWRLIPFISLVFISFQAFQKHPTLVAVSASLLVMKASEYSARRMLDEMVYVPLDYESRYLGKEIISVFGYRFGKSLISLTLSALTFAVGNLNLQVLSIFSNITAAVWVKTAWDVSFLVPTRNEAQSAYEKSTRK